MLKLHCSAPKVIGPFIDDSYPGFIFELTDEHHYGTNRANELRLWVYHQNYGVKTMVMGIFYGEDSIDKTLEAAVARLTQDMFIDDAVSSYMDEYMPDCDSLWDEYNPIDKDTAYPYSLFINNHSKCKEARVRYYSNDSLVPFLDAKRNVTAFTKQQGLYLAIWNSDKDEPDEAMRIEKDIDFTKGHFYIKPEGHRVYDDGRISHMASMAVIYYTEEKEDTNPMYGVKVFFSDINIQVSILDFVNKGGSCVYFYEYCFIDGSKEINGKRIYSENVFSYKDRKVIDLLITKLDMSAQEIAELMEYPEEAVSDYEEKFTNLLSVLKFPHFSDIPKME